MRHVGVAPTTHGSYEIGPRYDELPALDDVPTVQRYFKDHGYYTLSGGKVLHHGFTGRLADAIDQSLGREKGRRPRNVMNRLRRRKKLGIKIHRCRCRNTISN